MSVSTGRQLTSDLHPMLAQICCFHGCVITWAIEAADTSSRCCCPWDPDLFAATSLQSLGEAALQTCHGQALCALLADLTHQPW